MNSMASMSYRLSMVSAFTLFALLSVWALYSCAKIPEPLHLLPSASATLPPVLAQQVILRSYTLSNDLTQARVEAFLTAGDRSETMQVSFALSCGQREIVESWAREWKAAAASQLRIR